MNSTPLANRVHISFFGKTNTGKSSVVNTLLKQDIAIVSDVAGTTTDIVYKTTEINKIGACVIIDTPGFDDVSMLGEKRIKLTEKAIRKTDIAVLLICDDDFVEEKKWVNKFSENSIPFIIAINKADVFDHSYIVHLEKKIEENFDQNPIVVSAKDGEGIDYLYEKIASIGENLIEETTLCAHLVSKDDLVLLVMPQDIQAPRGRLILPQVQMIRDLLDNKCIVICINSDQIDEVISILNKEPRLIITDSQVVDKIYEKKPKNTIITTFSILFSRYKGDIGTFIEGAKALDFLDSKSKVLIAESCTHKPLEEDIGRIKIPRLLRNVIDKDIGVDICSGNDFPDDIPKYDLIIHCGACMFNRKHVLSRIKIAMDAGVPITNYGIAIAKLTGASERIDLSGVLK